MIKFIFLRHGESETNRTKKFTGQLDVNLTDVGKRQAEIAGAYILQNFKIDALYSSDLSRAIETITPVANALNLPVNKDKRLREFNLGKWTGLYIADVKLKYKTDFENYKNGGLSTCGESIFDVQRRAYDFVLEIAKSNQDKTVLIATHGGVIRALLMKWLNYNGADLYKIPIVSNNSITIVNYENEKFFIEEVSFDRYLDEMKTAQDKYLL